VRVVIQYGNVFRLNLLFFDAVFLLRSSLVRATVLAAAVASNGD
jgi:hypothetical protein